jgi:acetyl-CoA C-acetyltransferase
MRVSINEHETQPIIVAARRSPIGRIGGILKTLSIEQLAAPVLTAVLADAELSPDEVSEVILGNAIGPGGNPARVAALAAGFPAQVPGLTVDRQCGSGLEAIHLAARLVQAGAGDVILAGGVESVSTAPWRIEKPRSLYELPQFTHRARFAPEALGDPDMGAAAEAIAQRYGISRERQDRYALESHQKALTSQLSGRFAGEIVPIALSSVTVIETDECPRKLTLERLGRLPAAFCDGGTVTAGNACPINDGVAIVAIVSERKFQQLGLQRGLRILDSIAVGVDPQLPGMGPVAAVQALLQRHPAQIDCVEFNEAFASQVLACLDQLKISENLVNIGGGAIALGHPYGASGAILMTRLFSELVRSPQIPDRPPRVGLATIGVGGGMGLATLVERTG